MIKTIKITNQATIKDMEIAPYQVNYFFGGNGSGKTTISKFLDDNNNIENGFIVNDSDSEILVYNKSFVELNFRDKNAIQGIFTIGESAVDAISFIEEKEKEKREIEKDIQKYQNSIDSLQTEINNLLHEYEQNCWNIEKRVGPTFSEALKGYRGSVKVFAQKCKDSYNGNQCNLNLDELKTTYNQLFQKEVLEYSEVATFLINFNELETSPILSESIVNSSNSTFSKFIENLGNINWVSQGINFISNDKICPFCQQRIPAPIIEEMNSIFDETYTQSIELLKKLYSDYEQRKNDTTAFFNNIQSLINNIPFIDGANLFELKKDVLAIIDKNLSLLNNKLQTPATPCTLEDTTLIINKINTEINAYNKQINDNNILAKNISQARKDFSITLWDYIANNQLLSVIKEYKKALEGKNAGMANLLGYKKLKEDAKNACMSSIIEKRSSIVSIDNAIDEINNLLNGFGFHGFKIEKKDDVSYRFIRADGSEVKETLSEGEHRFITFLYYYQLVKGSLDKNSSAKNKILVIDDPISSLDSNILFIVSYLVRDLINKCLNGSNIEQIFVLTHNIYFHQEVCFKDRRNNISKTKEHFWVLRKCNETTTIIGYDENQIKSSYELLWQEYKNPTTDSLLICNIMRRILEHYFNIIGHKDYSKLIDEFEGQDKLICKSLLPYINTGSHIINDDFHLSIDKDMVDNYKSIFKNIFEKTNQVEHYNMIMGFD